MEKQVLQENLIMSVPVRLYQKQVPKEISAYSCLWNSYRHGRILRDGWRILVP